MTLDYVAGLLVIPDRHGVIAVILDASTKWIHTVLGIDTSDAVVCATLYVQHVVQHQVLSFVNSSNRSLCLEETSTRRLGVYKVYGISLECSHSQASPD